MKIKPFLRWAGGKQNLVDSLLDNSPSEELINKYYEPFLGAGSLFFSNGFDNAEISDINTQLINAYVQIKNDHERVHNLLKKYTNRFLLNQDYYYEIRRLYNQDLLQFNYIQASRFIFLIHCNFNGIYRVNNNGKYNVPIGRIKPFIPSLKHFEEVSKKLSEITIVCQDYNQILNKVKRNDFIYLDPPYPPSDWAKPIKQYTSKSFSKTDHEKLNDFANKLREKKCFVLISYPENEFIKEIYKDWKIINSHVLRSISGKKFRKKTPELLIKNF